MGYFRTSHVSWVLRKLSDVEEGRSEVEDDHGSPCGEVGYQGHELFGLDGAGIRGCKDESKLLLRKALFSVERDEGAIRISVSPKSFLFFAEWGLKGGAQPLADLSTEQSQHRADLTLCWIARRRPMKSKQPLHGMETSC